MTRDESTTWLNELVSAKHALDEQWDALRALLGMTPESPFSEAAWKPFELLVDAVTELLGGSSAVAWFVWENDCGANGMEHSLPDGSMRAVCAVDDLLDVLGLL